MKRTLPLLLLAIAMSHYAMGQSIPHWNNLQVYRTGALLPHDRIIPEGDYCRSLDGTWDFAIFDTPAQATLHPAHWDTIHVPGNIELQGFGTPVYVNMKNEFPSNPPTVPTDYNPTGVYHRTFTLPPHWQGRRTIVKFGAVKSAMYLYINGHEVGYSEDSKTPHEWDITRWLNGGVNHLTVKVLRWCNGSYLECQDMWRMSGITRSVELYSVPTTYISDIKVIADVDTTDYRTGRLDVLVDINQKVQGGSVEMEINGHRVSRRLAPRDWFVSFEQTVDSITPWTDSTPVLYPLVLRLYDADHRLLETISKRVGFRNLRIAHGQLLINGVPIEIRGVNRHEHSMIGGQYVTADEMRRDIAMMKGMGINAVRTSHYPNDELWYDLCDSAGIYIWDEANLESHAQGYGEQSLAKKVEWQDMFLDRVYNMYRRDRNHPSVIAWSLGNECGNGICMEEAYRRLKEYDPTRPVTYERAVFDGNTDIVEVMYSSAKELSDYARDPRNTRPFIIAEYCHAMGNSMGGLQDYWDTIDKYPQLQGGFVWDWIDQAFLMRGESRTTHGTAGMDSCWWAAGGDMGQLFGIVDDDAFCANGILAADHTPHPHAAEVEAVYTRQRRNLVLPPPPTTEDFQPQKGYLRLSNNKRGITIQNGNFQLVMNPTDGSISSYRLNGRDVLARPLRCNFWRPPTENDRVDPLGARAWQGLNEAERHVVNLNTSINRTRDTAEVQMLLHVISPDGNRIRVKQIVQVAADGRMQLSYMVAADGQYRSLPKLGLQLGLDTGYTYCSFYGNIYETYPDRRAAQRVGMFFKEMNEMAKPQYVVPQEQGTHESQWVRFVGDSLPPITFGSPHDAPMLNFSVRRHNDSTLTAARRWRNLVADDYYTISIDHRVAPLGTATCGPGVDERYIISGDSSYCYRFILSPLHNSSFSPYEGFAPHPDIQRLPPSADETALRLVVSNIESSQQPAQQYSQGFPTVLTDMRHAVPGDYLHGWAGFSGLDTLLLTLTLDHPSTLGEVRASLCHSPTDWVVKPLDVEVQWSSDSIKWSAWQSMTLQNQPANIFTDSRRLLYGLAVGKNSRVRFVRLRYICRPTLPPWHPYAGEAAWLMIDEVELRAR